MKTDVKICIEPLMLNTKTASEYLGLSVSTLRNWRTQGIGPKYVHVSSTKSTVLYKKADLDAWAETLS